jgi:hypothetical protein
MAEGIEVDRRARFNTEFLEEISLAHQGLADEGFASRQVAVRLYVPAAHDVPPALLHQSLDTAEQGGLVLLHPLVKNRLVVTKDELLELLTEPGGRAEGGERLSQAFLPHPQPDRVEVRIADQEQVASGHSSLQANISQSHAKGKKELIGDRPQFLF